MSCGFTRRLEQWKATCADGVVRHESLFPSRAEAAHWATWGHWCPFTPHRFVQVFGSVPESTGEPSSGPVSAGYPPAPSGPNRTDSPIRPVDPARSAWGKGGEPGSSLPGVEPSRAGSQTSLSNSLAETGAGYEDDWAGIDPWGTEGVCPVPVHVLDLVPKLRAAHPVPAREQGESRPTERAARSIWEALS